MTGTLAERVADVVAHVEASPVSLVVAVVDVDTGDAASHDAERIVPTASAAKVLLLAAVLREAAAGTLALADRIDVTDADRCGGSGLLAVFDDAPRRWSVRDLAVLVAAVSDNTATNTLLRHLGLGAVARTATELGLDGLRIHDQVRDERGPGTAPLFASGSARDLCRVFELAATDRLFGSDASRTLLAWTAHNQHRDLLSAGIRNDGLDDARPAVHVASKTGQDTGVRAEAGLIVGHRRLAFGAVAVTAAGRERHATSALRALGAALAG